ncbi:hypothetical protein D3C77_595800 [compost metagenome]
MLLQQPRAGIVRCKFNVIPLARGDSNPLIGNNSRTVYGLTIGSDYLKFMSMQMHRMREIARINQANSNLLPLLDHKLANGIACLPIDRI